MFNLQPRRSYFNGLFSLLLCASLYTVVNCAQSGVIESPNYPGKYTPNVVSRFHLTPDNSTGVFLLTFVPTFDVEGYEFVHCAYDWVAIYTDDEIDGLGDTCDPGNVWVKNSGVFCNHHLPDCQFWLRADRVVIEFCSDSIVQGLGFGLVWETESALTTGSPKTRRPPVPGCGFIVKTIIAGDRFHLKTPNYPDPYPADIFCNWVFTTEIGYHFQIVSQFFETQPGSINGVCTTDDLLISDPFGNSKTDYCGTLNIDIVSKGRAIDLKFYSNGDPVTFQGFDLIIASVTDHPMTALPSTAMPTGPSTLPPWQCGVYNTLMSLSQKIVFESQGYPSDYPIFFSCKYHFQSPLAVVNPRYRYKFTVLDFKTELQWDTLSFFDGATGAPLVSWSGDKLAGYSEMLDAPTVEAVFESDGSTSFRGFQVEVELIETEFTCPGRFKCGTWDRCIPTSQICDGITQCPNGMDEAAVLCSVESLCGRPVIAPNVDVSKLVGGTQAKPGSWPWTATLRFAATGGYRCGAVLVADGWILTVVECVYGSTLNPAAWKVRLGTAFLNSSSVDQEYQFESEVDTIFIHPNHALFSFDFALLKLKSPVPYPFNDHTNVACLPESNYETPESASCVSVGWGEKTDGCGLSGTMQQLVTPPISTDHCKYMLGPMGSTLTESMMCAGNILIQDGMGQGDAGSPLVCQMEDGHWSVVGLFNFRFDRHLPAIYAKVASGVEFIKSTMNAFN